MRAEEKERDPHIIMTPVVTNAAATIKSHIVAGLLEKRMGDILKKRRQKE